jgi:hypothetical protein
MLKRPSLLALVFASFVTLAPLQAEADPIISAGAPTTSVPTYLSDGSYLFGIQVTLGPGQFLLPVEITGASNLQSWQFDLLFDNTVVQEVDPLDGTSGIFGARFMPGDPNSLSFILGGFPFNSLGLVDDVAGSYPSLLSGPSGDGTLAFIEFEFLPDQETNDPGFGIENPTTQQVPEPETLALFAGGLVALFGARRRHLRGL